MAHQSRGIQQCIREFIEIYRSEPCLWQRKSKDYYNGRKKHAAYTKLAAKLKEIEPSANRDAVTKKINNIRSNFRKEIRKIKASAKSGTDCIHEPKLWYFKLLSFLTDSEDPKICSAKIEMVENEIETEDHSAEITSDKAEFQSASPIYTDDENSSAPSTPTSASQRRHSRSTEMRLESTALTNDALLSRKNNKRPLSRNGSPDIFGKSIAINSVMQDDRFDVFGKNVAMKLRDLPKQQRIIAEKIINDALFEAEMGNLTTTHKLTYESPLHSQMTTPSPTPIDETQF